jgi:putative membrane protein
VTPASAPPARARDVPEADPRVYFAAERTLLAWIRTGLAMMGFGFVVARFALYLRELAVPAGRTQAGRIQTGSPDGSLWLGVALVLLGVLVTLWAARRHARLMHRLRTGTWTPDHTSRSAIAAAIALAVVGLAVTAYLMLV